LQGINKTISSTGATLVALSPSTREHAAAMAEKGEITFDILCDPGNSYAEKLGLSFALPSNLREVYSGLGIDLPAFNGDSSWTLPIPARFVVNMQGLIRYVEADVDYTVRPEPEETLAALKTVV
jgi:peroxiredoxin